jgi:hypothetical protein
MAKLVPAHPLFGDGERAERAVWEALRDQLPHRDADGTFEAPGLPRALLIDRQDLKQIDDKLRQALDLHGDGSAPLSASGAQEMTHLLTGPNLAAADIFAFSAEHEERVRQMTEDQMRSLGLFSPPAPGRDRRSRRQWQDVAGAGADATPGQGRSVGRPRLLLPWSGALPAGCYERSGSHAKGRPTWGFSMSGR